jgi:hypothetical protein
MLLSLMARPKGRASRRRNAAAYLLPPRRGRPQQVASSGTPLADLFRGSEPSQS